MSFILFLLILWLLYYLARPLIRMWRISRKFRNGDPSVFNDLFGNPGAQQSSSSYDRNGRRKGGWTMPGIRRKKIGKDVGEYVKFQEIKTEQTYSHSDPDVSYVREEQITDVEWEDVK